MKRLVQTVAAGAAFAALFMLAAPASAEFEVKGPDGRRIVLYDNGTWRYTGTQEEATTARSVPEEAVQAILTLERKIERGSNCRYGVHLVNTLPYEIKTLVPFYAAYRADGVIYDTVSASSGFTSMKPGDEQSREFDIIGLGCDKIARIQVLGGDRCEMGELTKFSEKGQCLARVRVVESQIVRFDK